MSGCESVECSEINSVGSPVHSGFEFSQILNPCPQLEDYLEKEFLGQEKVRVERQMSGVDLSV